MAYFSNLLNSSNSNPLNIALSNKITPSPLAPAKTLPDVKTPVGTPGGYDLARNSIVPKSSTPVGTPGGFDAAKPGSTGNVTGDHLTGIIKLASNMQKSSPSAQTGTPPVTPSTTPGTQPPANQPDSMYAQDVKAGQGYLQGAANLENNKELSLAETEHNPYYSQAIAMGRGGLIQQLGAAQQTALGTNASAAFTGAQSVAPVLQFGQLTDPTTGKVIGAGTSGNNPALDSAVQSAVQIAQKSGPSAGLATLGGYGQAGVNAFNQEMLKSNPGYNPLTADATAQQNASQAVEYQGQATQIDTALKQVDAIAPLVTKFLTDSGLNSTSNPHVNNALNTYYGNFLNSGNKAILEQYMGDIKKFTSQVLAANTGTIPTDTAQTLATFDPSNLTASQLQPYLDNLRQLGGNQLAVLQGQSQASGGGGYSGSPATVGTTPITAPGNTLPTAQQGTQAAIGALMNMIGGIHPGQVVGGAIGGAAEGYASKILGSMI